MVRDPKAPEPQAGGDKAYVRDVLATALIGLFPADIPLERLLDHLEQPR